MRPSTCVTSAYLLVMCAILRFVKIVVLIDWIQCGTQGEIWARVHGVWIQTWWAVEICQQLELQEWCYDKKRRWQLFTLIHAQSKHNCLAWLQTLVLPVFLRFALTSLTHARLSDTETSLNRIQKLTLTTPQMVVYVSSAVLSELERIITESEILKFAILIPFAYLLSGPMLLDSLCARCWQY